MTLHVLSQVLAKHGISHSQSKSDPNFVKIYELIDGRSVPVILVNLVDGSFLEMQHYSLMPNKSKAAIAGAYAEYRRRFKAWYKKS